MDVHRCRFVPYPPQPITAIAFTHASDPSKPAPKDLRLALARAIGDIEIWSPLGGKWLQESTLRGVAGKTVDQLAWTQDFEIEDDGNNTTAKPGQLRLFSSDGSARITEWDVARGTRKRHAEGNFGDLWCFAAQPAYKVPKDGKVDGAPPAQLLVGGCCDASIALFSTEEDDLRFLRLLAGSPGKRQKILSITWRDRNTVVAGYEDGMIRVFNVNDRRVIRTMTLGKTPEGGKSIVWSLKCLPDGTILSGDSSGELKIWDTKNFSCTQVLKTHQGDILDIVSNAKGDLVFTVAVDRRTVAYKPIASTQGKKGQRWARLMHQRYHDHDVNCAASYESKGMSFLVTGSKDTTPVVLPMQNWQTEYHRALPNLPQRPQMSASPTSRLLLSWWQRDLHIYHLPRRNHNGTALLNLESGESQDHEQLATLRLSSDEHIQSAEISQDGNYVVASTSTGVRLFQLRKVAAKGKLSLRTRPIELPPALRSFGARHVSFSRNGHWIVAVRLDNTILLAKLVSSHDPKERPTIHGRIVKLSPRNRRQSDGALGHYSENVNTVTFSPDSRVVATGDLSGSINTWVLEGHEDLTYVDSEPDHSSDSSSDSDSDSGSDDGDTESPIIHGQRWTRSPEDTNFPRIDSAILAVTFRPPPSSHNHTHHPAQASFSPHPTRHNPRPVVHTSPTTTSLVAITATHNLVELDVITGRLTDWSRRNPSSLLPTNFTRLRDRLIGVFWDTSHDRQRLWMYGKSWMYMLDLGYDLPPPSKVLQSKSKTQGDIDGLEQAGQEGEHSGIKTKKRKRRLSHGKNSDKGTGAGGMLKDTDRGNIGFGPFSVNYKGTGDSDAMDIVDLDKRLAAASDDEDHLPDSHALIRLRRGQDDVDMQDASADVAADDYAGVNGTLLTPQKPAHPHPRNQQTGAKTKSFEKGKDVTHWGTFHYRDIFGIAVLSDPDASTPTSNQTGSTQKVHGDGDVTVNGNDDRNSNVHGEPEERNTSPNALEIVVVERPLYDVVLPPRFEGGQDWDT